jgi:hypothetical protein
MANKLSGAKPVVAGRAGNPLPAASQTHDGAHGVTRPTAKLKPSDIPGTRVIYCGVPCRTGQLLGETKEKRAFKGLGNKLLICICLYVLGSLMALADTIVMSNNRTITGIAIQTNDDDVLILTHYAAFSFSAASIKGIQPDSTGIAESSNKNGLPDFQNAILFLSKQPWATNLTPIPATVIDTGILRHVPYTSFRCGVDYEVNIYGDLENPAGIEVGVYRKLINDSSAKDNCVNFICDLLRQPADKEAVRGLDRNQDLKTRGDLTFEITPTNAEDSYNGWWVSVYSEKQLNLTRASDDEMKLISMTQADVAKDAAQSKESGSWTVDDLKRARPANQTTITFINSSGVLIKNAEVVRVIDGVSLIWRNGPTSGGMVRLADLPASLRVRFGYDEVKTKAADELAKAKKLEWEQAVQAAAQTAQVLPAQSDFSSYGDSFFSGAASGGGSVYVRGYYRSNGTYVNSYTRSYPHSR